jgi:parvulin-like peptidyl-prolyl isomerase
VETQFGFHLIKVLDHKEAGKIDFKEVEKRIVEDLRNKQIQQKIEAYLTELRKTAKIETFVGK